MDHLWRRNLVVIGFSFLLISSFLDNLRGPLLPQITADLGLDYSRSSSLIFIGNLFSFGVMLLLSRLSRRFSISQMALASIATTVLACGLSGLVQSQQMLWFFAAGLGSAIIALGSLSNIFVIEGTPKRLRARVLSGLHSLYGFGSVAAALVVAWQSNLGIHWSRIFSVMSVAVFGMCVWMFLQIPTNATADRAASRPSLRISDYITCLPIVFYVLGEVGCSTWLVTFVVKEHALSESQASILLSIFFGMMAVSRVAVFLFSKPGTEWLWIYSSMLIAIIAFVGGLTISPYFLPLSGVFGPFFPLYVNQIQAHHASDWQSILFMCFALMHAGMALMHAAMGHVVDLFGAGTAYLGPLVFLFIALILTMLQQMRFASMKIRETEIVSKLS